MLDLIPLAPVHDMQKLSKYKFEAEPLEVQLTEDLAGSLRQLKPEGSLVKDRFRYHLFAFYGLPWLSPAHPQKTTVTRNGF